MLYSLWLFIVIINYSVWGDVGNTDARRLECPILDLSLPPHARIIIYTVAIISIIYFDLGDGGNHRDP